MDVSFKCKDDPEANGRIAQLGDQRYTVIFPLEDGNNLSVSMGKGGMNHFASFIAQMMVDEVEENK